MTYSAEDTHAELSQEYPSYAYIEDFVDNRIYSSPYYLHMRGDVDTLQKDATRYDTMVQKCLKTVEESEETNTVQFKKIYHSLKIMRRELDRYRENQSLSQGLSEARPGPPSPKITKAKLYGERLMDKIMSRRPSNTSVDDYLDSLAARFTEPTRPSLKFGSSLLLSSSPAHTGASVSSPATFPISSDDTPRKTTEGIELQRPSGFENAPPSQADHPPSPRQPIPVLGDDITSSLPQLSADYENAVLGILGTINSWLEAFDATRNGGTMSSSIAHLVNKYDAPSHRALLSFVFWLAQLLDDWNANLEACLKCGGRHARTLLHTIFTLHPLLTRAYPAIESGLLSLHTTTLLVACMLYIQEAFFLATQMDPQFTIA